MFVVLSQVDTKAARYDDLGNMLPESAFASYVNPSHLRGFYRRHDGKQGTRVTFADGGGFAVLESVDQIASAIAQVAATGGIIVAAPDGVEPVAPPAPQVAAEESSEEAEGEEAEALAEEAQAAPQAEEAPAPRRPRRRSAASVAADEAQIASAEGAQE